MNKMSVFFSIPGASLVKSVIQVRCNIGMPTGPSEVCVCVCVCVHGHTLESADSAYGHFECECVCA